MLLDEVKWPIINANSVHLLTPHLRYKLVESLLLYLNGDENRTTEISEILRDG